MSCDQIINAEYLEGMNEDLKNFLEKANSTLLNQNRKIAQLENYIKCNLESYLIKLFNAMDNNGELTEIIGDTLLKDIVDSIEKTNVFYNGINTNKIFDDVSGTYYYVSKIPRFDENGIIIPLKMGLANDDKSASTLEGTLKHAWRKNATLCINCGVWNVETVKPIASVIYEGEIIYRDIPTVTPEKYQYFAITRDHQYKVYPIGTTPEAMLREGVYYACAIFQSLIIEGEPVTQTDERLEPRQSIGFNSAGDIIIISCDGRNSESNGMSYNDLARLHALNGSINAYILDGGGSTSTVLRGIKQNENIDNFTTDRSVGTFLYVAKETNVSIENNAGNDIGRVKQFLIGQIRSKTDFPLGQISLRAGEGRLYPTIEMYADGEAKRMGRITLSYDETNQRNTYIYIGLKGPEDTSEKTNLFRIFPQGVWMQTYHGTASERPSGVVGLCYFDESLNRPIWYTGKAWVTAEGEIVDF